MDGNSGDGDTGIFDGYNALHLGAERMEGVLR